MAHPRYPKDEVEFRRNKNGATIPLHNGRPIKGTKAAKGIAASKQQKGAKQKSSPPSGKTAPSPEAIKVNTERARQAPDMALFRSYFDKPQNDTPIKALKDYFFNEIQGKPVTTMLDGNPQTVNFSFKYTFRELDDNLASDSVKQELVAWLPHIVVNGHDRPNPMNKPHGETEAFYSKQMRIKTSQGEFDVIVDIGYRPRLEEKYTAHGMVREGTHSWNRRMENEKKAKDESLALATDELRKALRLSLKRASLSAHATAIGGNTAPRLTALDANINDALYVVNIKVSPVAAQDSMPVYTGVFAGLNRIRHGV